MNQRFAYLMAAGLALAAGPHAAISASSQGQSVAVGDVDIIVDGARLPRYAHEGRWYVEARKGRVPAIMQETSKDERSRQQPAPPSSAPTEQETASAKRADDEFAATGMGRRTGHAVTQVWLNLEDIPAQTVNIRYEFRPQLVRLGILPPVPTADPLQRRERARGFEPGFSPEPPLQR